MHRNPVLSFSASSVSLIIINVSMSVLKQRERVAIVERFIAFN